MSVKFRLLRKMESESGKVSLKAEDFSVKLESDHSEGTVSSGKTEMDSESGCLNDAWDICEPREVCHRNNYLLKTFLMVLVILLLYGAIYLLLGESAKPPSGKIFQLFLLIIAAIVCGQLMAVINLPPLLGMLIAGILLKNFKVYTVDDKDFEEALLDLRKMALAVILIKAGLYLNPTALKELNWLVIRLAFTPCCLEAIAAMIASHFILGLPLLWGLLLGFVLGAVSPAIVVPSLLSLQKRGYGAKSVHTLGIAASTIDDILAISAFEFIKGLIFENGDIWENIIKVPLEIVAGISVGSSYGLLLLYLPHFSDKNVVFWRTTLLSTGGIVALFGSAAVGFEGVGPLACMIAAFVASTGWSVHLEDQNIVKGVTTAFSGIWFIFEPILFSLIGTEIILADLSLEDVLKSLAIVIVALTVRTLAAFFVTLGGKLSLEERLFLAVAWLPKASVQGLLGPIALEAAMAADDVEKSYYGRRILKMAVISILVTAPIGAVAIRLAGSKLLKNHDDTDDTENKN